MADLAARVQALDDDVIEATLARHSSGVALLAAPSELERAEAVAPEELQQILEALRERFEYVVVDTSPFLDQNSLVTLDMSDVLLLVCAPSWRPSRTPPVFSSSPKRWTTARRRRGSS